MLIGVIADDYTGASDIANTLAKGSGQNSGLIVSQFFGIPNNNAPSDVEVGVVSLKSRSIPSPEAIEQSLAALEWLLAQGCEQIIFKYCSTFDSSPAGNIGQVGEALAHKLGVKGVIVCPAFPTVGRTVHQGHLFVNDTLLNESGMQNHPQTPMTDANLRRWTQQQCQDTVGLVACDIVRQGTNAVQTALTAAADRGETLVICDAATDQDLIILGKAAATAKLLTGGSGIAIGLPANFIAQGKAKGCAPTPYPMSGHEAILAGSCSGATLKQVEIHAKNHPTLAIDMNKLMDGSMNVTTLCDFIESNFGNKPLIYSSGNPQQVTAIQAKYGKQQVSEKLDNLFAGTAKQLVANGVTRLVVAGGETSGAVSQALNLGALKIGIEIDPGVPILIAEQRGIALALKSGNFGGDDFFARAVTMLKGDLNE